MPLRRTTTVTIETNTKTLSLCDTCRGALFLLTKNTLMRVCFVLYTIVPERERRKSDKRSSSPPFVIIFAFMVRISCLIPKISS